MNDIPQRNAGGTLPVYDAGPVTYYFEVSPLLEEHWTGIPVVAAGLAREFLRIHPDNTEFFFERFVIRRDCVEDALFRNSGKFLERQFATGSGDKGVIDVGDDTRIKVGIFPSIKRIRGVFDIECSIIHDLSTLITPHFHTIENITYHMDAICDDILSNAVTGCVSQATLDDVKHYFGVPDEKLALLLNGIGWQQRDILAAGNAIDVDRMEPYFLILGTREPRKNIMRVIEMLALFPELMSTHKFVFAGRMGWLMEQQAIPAQLQNAMDEGRLVFPGYVTESQKCALLMGAEASIYPSYFEGFGLPIAESLSLGTPCVASWTSSIPEVGGEVCSYFDPFSVSDLCRAVAAVIRQRPKRDPAFREACRQQAAQFTWQNCMSSLETVLSPHIDKAIRDKRAGA